VSIASDKTTRELKSVRDTVESVWVAVILAFVLRAFVIEAFVIPTGSMAPRLLGEHMDLVCPACGYEYTLGVPSTVQESGEFNRRLPQTAAGAVCPNCGLTHPSSENPGSPRGGDRVLVMKYLYRFGEPRPWDVVVFRNPQNDRENYIKRLIGLPGERIQIVHGDVYVDSGDGKWHIRTKPHRAQKAMWQVIYDDDYPPNEQIYEKLDRLSERAPGWTVAEGPWDLSTMFGRRFSYTGGTEGRITFDGGRDDFLPHYGYNLRNREDRAIDRASDVCNDLRLSAVFAPVSASAKASFVLTSFEDRFRADVHADGKVELLHGVGGGQWEVWAAARIDPVPPGRTRTVDFYNVDYRLGIRIDGREVLASTPEQYSSDFDALVRRMRRADRDPLPVPRVEILGAGGPFQLWHVGLYRDVFYTCASLMEIARNPLTDFAVAQGLNPARAARLPGWGTMGNPIALAKFPDRPELDQFFMLGDNSPESLDSRCWVEAAPTLRLYDESHRPIYQLGTVPRYNLIGQAFFVYWPAGFGVPGLPGLPIVPNPGKMRLIR
jgi:signal peptidase I